MKRVVLFAVLILSFFATYWDCCSGQTFDVQDYKAYLNAQLTMSGKDLLNASPIAPLKKQISPLPHVRYLDTITTKFKLTADETALLNDHGFMVTERLTNDQFESAFLQVWQKDLPVFISTDAILQALHASYDAILKFTEYVFFIPELKAILSKMNASVAALDAQYQSVPAVQLSLRDVDVFVTVARSLLTSSTVAPYYSENSAKVAELLNDIKGEAMAPVQLFGAASRKYDFSQFTIRGHYSDYPELGAYFKTMMWLGRTEFLLSKPVNSDYNPSADDISRQIIESYLIREALAKDSTMTPYRIIDNTLRFLIGESDNVTVDYLDSLHAAAGFSSVFDLTNTTVMNHFKAILPTKSYAVQNINSQILGSDPSDPEQVQLPSVFLFLGQRFIVDSYIFQNVVYDKIAHKVRRMLPSPQDALYALGNNASAILLQDELNKYSYAPNLAALRYLIDANGDDFWNASLYNTWLNGIRSLNPPDDVSRLPECMQTSAWWLEKMNTQLASWAQLRHDNLLYAKQSYTGDMTCSYPEGYVEPFPQLYHSLADFAAKGE